MTKDRFDRLIDDAPSADKIDAVTRSLLSFRRFNEQILGQNLIAAGFARRDAPIRPIVYHFGIEKHAN